LKRLNDDDIDDITVYRRRHRPRLKRYIQYTVYLTLRRMRNRLRDWTALPLCRHPLMTSLITCQRTAL